MGGLQAAGQGMRYGVLDSGIDQTHPAFQDNSLAMPSGYPICSGFDCSFTNSKVMVAEATFVNWQRGALRIRRRLSPR